MFRVALVALAAVALLIAVQYVSQGRFVLVGMQSGSYRIYDSLHGRVYEVPLIPPTPDPKIEHDAQPPAAFKPEI